MDPRVKYTQINSGQHLAFGRKFASREEAEQYASETIRRREALANRTLTAAELDDGLARRDNRTAIERSKDRLWQITPVSQPAAEEPNPFRAAMSRGDHLPRKRETRKQLYERAAKEYDAKLAAEAAAEEFASDPRRAKAVAIAEQALELVQFDPAASFAEVERAKQTLAQAKSGCLDVAKQMLDEGRAVREQRHDARTAELDKQIATLRAERVGHVGEEFEPAEPVKRHVYYPPEYVGDVPPEERERSNREYAAWQAEQRQEQSE
jgi:hypothetical protein